MPFEPMPASVRPEMQRVIAAPRKLAVHGDEVLHVGYLARQDDALARQPQLFGPPRAADGRYHERLAHHRRRFPRLGQPGIVVHQPRQQLLIEAAPVDADAHRLAPFQRVLDHDRELRVVLRALADVAGIDPVLGERLRAVGVLAQQLVAVEMEIADERNAAAVGIESLADRGHGGGGLLGVDGDPHQFGTGRGERLDLGDGCADVGGIGVGHRLHHDGRAAADGDVTHARRARAVADDRRVSGIAHGSRLRSGAAGQRSGACSATDRPAYPDRPA